MNRNRLSLAIVAATVFLLLAVMLVASSVSNAATPTVEERPQGCTPYKPGECPFESMHLLPSTSTSTIDLSFLNTTTTTVPMSTQVATLAPLPPQTSTDLSDRWDILAQCETGGDWATNTGNGFGGGLQFAHGPGWSTWRAYGGEEFSSHPWEASREQQIVIAERVLAGSGWKAWPGCARLNGWLS